ncbi:hypothetical protein [Kitasatospora indigofera]|uniref:hypothetical protein n=1 Tax=Kitasatospora indigofera TaxID=67307 RepID=UPI0036B0E9DC
MFADPTTAALPSAAAQLLRQFNEAAMIGPTLNPADLADAFDGLVHATGYLPNTLRHLHGHLLSVQRSRTLVPTSEDTDELLERVRQRCYDVADSLQPLEAKLKEIRTLVTGLSATGDGHTEAVIPDQRTLTGPTPCGEASAACV